MGEVAEINKGSLSVGLSAIKGTESLHLTKEDLVMPYVKIDKNNGNMINSLSGEAMPNKFIPIKIWKHWVQFINMKKDWSSDDPNDPRVIEFAKWGPNGEKPIADEQINVLSIFDGMDMPAILTFKRTSHKTGRKLITMVSTGIRNSIFEKKFNISTSLETNDLKQKFYVYNVLPAGKTTDEEYKTALSIFNLFSDQHIEVEDSID